MAKNDTLKIVGVSCAAVVVIAGLAFAVLGYLGYKQVQSIKEGVTNPEPGALEMLGATSLPEGYYANMAIKVPFITDTVVISDQPNQDDEPPKIGEGQGFLYSIVKVAEEKDSEKVAAFFAGESDDTSVLKDNHINVDLNPEDILTRGVVDMAPMTVRYLTTTEGVRNEHVNADGLTTFMLLQCPDNKLRFAMWFSPADSVEDGTPQLEGSVGDPEKIRAFLSHFQPCGKASEEQ